MSELRVVIVGAGLGGSLLADALAKQNIDVTVVTEVGPAYVRDTGFPAGLWPHVLHGPGGATRTWHNGLVRLPKTVFQAWPAALKAGIETYYQRVYPVLGDAPWLLVAGAAEKLRASHLQLGVPDDVLGEVLYYPLKRRNIWHHLKLDGRVRLITGRCLPLKKAKNGKVPYVDIVTALGTQRVEADVFVVAAGGLGTPLLLQELSDQAGRHYEDHPAGFVAEVELTESFFKLWNSRSPGIPATMRQSLVVEGPHSLVAFYLRPAFHLVSQAKRDQVTSVMSDLRNQSSNWRLYWKLFSHIDDVFDILSFKLGIRVSTRHYTLMMVAQQPSQPGVAVTHEGKGCVRHWDLNDAYLQGLEVAVGRLMEKLDGLVVGWRLLPKWRETLISSSHHSGTARIADHAEDGACDADGKVFGTENVYVADASALPATGYSNTGLTIGAMALRLGDHLAQLQPKQDKEKVPMNETVDIVVTGSGGFIGQRVVPLLEALGLTVVDAATFGRKRGMKARWALHLANIHGNPTANVRLMREYLDAYRDRVDHWIVPMTFGTLSGGGKVDGRRFNAGKRPWILNAYAAGKLLQERVLLKAARKEQVAAVMMPYVPLIADNLSPWDMQKTQMETYGYRAGGTFAEGTGPQLIQLADLAGWIHGVVAKGVPAKTLGRAVLRNKELDADWKVFLASYKVLPWVWAGRVHQVKFGIRQLLGLVLGLAWRVGALELVCRCLWRNPNPQATRRSYVAGEGPAVYEPYDPTFSQPRMGSLAGPTLTEYR